MIHHHHDARTDEAASYMFLLGSTWEHLLFSTFNHLGVVQVYAVSMCIVFFSCTEHMDIVT